VIELFLLRDLHEPAGMKSISHQPLLWLPSTIEVIWEKSASMMMSELVLFFDKQQ
jgi:hypothetical protein